MYKKIQAKLVAYNAIREQIYEALRLDLPDLTNEFTFSLAVQRATRKLRQATDEMGSMALEVSYAPTPAELAEAIRLSEQGILNN